MQNSPNPQDNHESILSRYTKRQNLYGVTRAVIEHPDIPVSGKLQIGLVCAVGTFIVLLGISRSPWEAYGFLLVCHITSAILIHKTKSPSRKSSGWHTRTPKSRLRRPSKSKFRGPSQ